MLVERMCPAQMLLGRELPKGWKVVEQLPAPSERGGTGGHFSVGYIVEGPDGKQAFLKALDLSSAFHAPDMMSELKRMTTAYTYERDLLAKCKAKNLDRVVVAIDDGQVQVENFPAPVPYLVFQRADGTVREHLVNLAGSVELAWKLRALHHIATALRQLHGLRVAHQDLKPSNVLVFAGRESKVGDLGRASTMDDPQPHDDCQFAGDRTYAPPELLYGFGSRDWNERRFGCDAYHLGSMVIFFFLGEGRHAWL